MGGMSNVSEASLYIDECKAGSFEMVDFMDLQEGNAGILEFEVFNCGNTWMEYDLVIDGIARAKSRGFSIEAENVEIIELYYQTSEIRKIEIYVDDIEEDISTTLEFTLKGHESGDEFCSHVVMINAVEGGSPVDPVKPNGGEDTTPDNDDDPIPDEGSSGDDPQDESEETGEKEGSSFMGTWIIIPIAIFLILVGIGSYALIGNRRMEVPG
jgi:hypothetical protein